jgi:hypothetical protein
VISVNAFYLDKLAQALKQADASYMVEGALKIPTVNETVWVRRGEDGDLEVWLAEQPSEATP